MDLQTIMTDSVQSLIVSGMTKTEAKETLVLFTPVVREIFQNRVRRAFSENEIVRINQEGKDKGGSGGVVFLEEEYRQKTGKNFLQLQAEISREVAEALAAAMGQGKQNLQKLKQMTQDQVKELTAAYVAKNAEEFKRLAVAGGLAV